VRLIGVIPEDNAVFQSVHEKIPLALYGRHRAAFNYFDVARRITGENLPLKVYIKRSPVKYRDVFPGQTDKQKESTAKYLGSTVGSYGDPAKWAVSTLKPGEGRELVRVFQVKQGMNTSGDSVRNRMWLHDILDDRGIPYHVEMDGYWAGRRKYVEVQYIFVEEKQRKSVQRLIKEFRNPDNIVERDVVDGDNELWQ